MHKLRIKWTEVVWDGLIMSNVKLQMLWYIRVNHGGWKCFRRRGRPKITWKRSCLKRPIISWNLCRHGERCSIIEEKYLYRLCQSVGYTFNMIVLSLREILAEYIGFAPQTSQKKNCFDTCTKDCTYWHRNSRQIVPIRSLNGNLCI